MLPLPFPDNWPARSMSGLRHIRAPGLCRQPRARKHHRQLPSEQPGTTHRHHGRRRRNTHCRHSSPTYSRGLPGSRCPRAAPGRMHQRRRTPESRRTRRRDQRGGRSVDNCRLRDRPCRGCTTHRSRRMERCSTRRRHTFPTHTLGTHGTSSPRPCRSHMRPCRRTPEGSGIRRSDLLLLVLLRTARMVSRSSTRHTPRKFPGRASSNTSRRRSALVRIRRRRCRPCQW